MGESSFLQTNYENDNINNHRKINGSNDFNSYGDSHKKTDFDGDKILLNSEISNQSNSLIFEDNHNKLR